MSKNTKKNIKSSAADSSVQDVNTSGKANFSHPASTPSGMTFLDKLTSGFIPFIIISFLGIVLYANTFHHQYALDDEIVICENTNVLRGFDGIADIFKSDIFDTYNKSLNSTASLTGGRYRPFSLATFAIEQEFIGTLPEGIQKDSWDLNQNKIGDANEDVNKDGVYDDKDVKVKGMAFRHVNNVLLYILSICFLYLFLSRFFFKDKKIIALMVSLLFLSHPIHTEVVANVKSRDEILSLMFMVLTLHLSFLYYETKKNKLWIGALFCYFMGLLSKEYGATLLLIVPASLYVYYSDFKLNQNLKLLGGILAVFVVYYLLRSNVVGGMQTNTAQESDLFGNPYLYANEMQAIATKIYVNLKYFLLLLFPITLSSDYGFNSIPYRSFSDPEVWLSIVLLLSLGLLPFGHL